VTYFVGTAVVAVPTLIQMTTGFCVWSEKYGFVKDVIMRGLYAYLTIDSD
jgi:hypothetical protein